MLLVDSFDGKSEASVEGTLHGHKGFFNSAMTVMNNQHFLALMTAVRASDESDEARYSSHCEDAAKGMLRSSEVAIASVTCFIIPQLLCMSLRRSMRIFINTEWSSPVIVWVVVLQLPSQH